MKLKWAILIAIGTLLVGALIGSIFTPVRTTGPSVYISGGELKCADDENGITKCDIINPIGDNLTVAVAVPDKAVGNDFSIKSTPDGQEVNCVFTKVDHVENDSEYVYVCT